MHHHESGKEVIIGNWWFCGSIKE